jgi:hypothetical protein
MDVASDSLMAARLARAPSVASTGALREVDCLERFRSRKAAQGVSPQAKRAQEGPCPLNLRTR